MYILLIKVLIYFVFLIEILINIYIDIEARYKKKLREPLAEVRPQPPTLSNKQITKKYFFQNSWSFPQAYRSDGRRRKSPLDGAIDFPSKIWHHITTVSFVSAFFFVLIRKPADIYKYV